MRTLCIWGFDEQKGGKAKSLAAPDKDIADTIRQFQGYKVNGLPAGVLRAELWDTERRGIVMTFGPAVPKPEPIATPPKVTTMKKTIASLITLAALAFGALTASAQTSPVYAPVTLISAVTLTNNTALSNAQMTAQTVVLDVRKQDYVGLQLSYGCAQSEKHTNYLTFEQSLDGVNYSANTPFIVELGDTIDPAAGATKCFVTNLTTRGIGYLRLKYTTNHSVAEFDFTNYTLKASIKIP